MREGCACQKKKNEVHDKRVVEWKAVGARPRRNEKRMLLSFELPGLGHPAAHGQHAAA